VVLGVYTSRIADHRFKKIDIRSIFCFLFLMFLSACAANLAALVKHR
jgi:hypothetical protein